jgi:predicted nucleotidyltransferase
MNVFDNYTHQVLKVLLNYNVQFIVVGGYAVNYYGYRRTTGDIDLLLKPENGNNKSLLLNAFRDLKIEEEVLTELKKLDFENPLVFMDGEEPFRIDFLTKISGVNFDDAWNLREVASFDGLKIPFIHYNHLILSKLSSDRLKDKVDVEELQKLRAAKNKL